MAGGGKGGVGGEGAAIRRIEKAEYYFSLHFLMIP